MAFEELGLKEWLVQQISTVGYRTPTPVQVNCIPPILQGVIEQSCSCHLVLPRVLHTW